MYTRIDAISRSLPRKPPCFKVRIHVSRRQIPYLVTYPHLGTLRENILLGVNDQTTTEEQLHQACRDASIHEFIVSLPEGYNTNIGSRGVTLSGGQKQRVAIGRCSSDGLGGNTAAGTCSIINDELLTKAI